METRGENTQGTGTEAIQLEMYKNARTTLHFNLKGYHNDVQTCDVEPSKDVLKMTCFL